METKVCNHCRETKPVDQFNWRWKKLGKRQNTCRSCQKIQQKRWYENNKKTHKENMYRNRQAKMKDGRQYIWNYLSTHPCVDCGESDPIVLEFDHVRGKKRASVTRLVRNGFGVNIIQKEIDKCEVVCSICHKRRTYKGAWRNRMIEEGLG